MYSLSSALRMPPRQCEKLPSQSGFAPLRPLSFYGFPGPFQRVIMGAAVLASYAEVVLMKPEFRFNSQPDRLRICCTLLQRWLSDARGVADVPEHYPVQVLWPGRGNSNDKNDVPLWAAMRCPSWCAKYAPPVPGRRVWVSDMYLMV